MQYTFAAFSSSMSNQKFRLSKKWTEPVLFYRFDGGIVFQKPKYVSFFTALPFHPLNKYILHKASYPVSPLQQNGI